MKEPTAVQYTTPDEGAALRAWQHLLSKKPRLDSINIYIRQSSAFPPRRLSPLNTTVNCLVTISEQFRLFMMKPQNGRQAPITTQLALNVNEIYCCNRSQN